MRRGARARGAAVGMAAAGLLCGCGDAAVPAPGPAAAAPGACARHAFRDHGAVRLFAMQPRIAPEHLESIATFHDHLVGLVEREVVPCLATDRPNLIVFPEDTGLPAAFLGARGAEARTKKGATAAFLSLMGPYQAAIDHYTAEYPGLTLPQPLLLALTDTLWRAFYETSREIAIGTGAWVVSSTNVSGAIEKSDDAAEIAALGDPELAATGYVYAARDPAIYNTAFVFDPTGEIVGRARKPYLVPLEEDQLRFAFGPLAEVAPVDLGFARLGILTSKDAWMPDVVDRLAALGADLFVQPEAFSGWGIEELPGDWLPDVFRQSAWAATQKHGGFRAAVVPHLTGNLFDQVFDGQSAILADAVPGEAGAAYVGQDPAGGFVAVAPWVIEDPGAADPELSLDDRRAALRAAGEALRPGAENENGYVETAVAADLDPAAPFATTAGGPPGALGASAEVAPDAPGEQLAPAIASDGAGGVWIAWQEGSGAAAQVRVARSSDAGASFGAAVAVAPSAGAQLAPTIASTPGGLYVSWVERGPLGGRVMSARSSDGGATFGAPVPVSAGPSDEWGPALATDGGRVYLAFAASGGGSGGAANERIVVGSADAGSDGWQLTPADGGLVELAPYDFRHNQWSPAIAARGAEVAVAWVDFRDANWDVYLSRSSDAGLSFGPAVRIDDGTDALERLDDDPSLAWDAGGALLCAWTDLRLRRTPTKARVVPVGASIAPSTVLGGAPENASAWRPHLAALGSGTIAAVWQDGRTMGNDVYVAVSHDGGASFGAEQRVDDGGEGASYAFAPRIAGVGAGAAVVVWEDTRAGARRLRYVAGTP